MDGVDGDTPSSHPLKGWYLYGYYSNFLFMQWVGVKSNAGYPLTDSIHWLLKVRSSAARASTWAGEAPSVFKHISTCEARGRQDNHLFSLGCCRACNMRKMLINFFFPNSHRLGEFSGAHIIFT